VLAALLGPGTARYPVAIQRSPLDDLFVTDGTQAPPDTTGVVPASSSEEVSEPSTPGAIVIEAADSDGRPTTTEVNGTVTFQPPLDRPTVVVRPDGTKTVLLPDASGGILVIQPDGSRVVVHGDVVFSPDDKAADGGTQRPAESKAEAGWLDQPALSFASRGEKVRELQNLLNQSGAAPLLIADGDFGPGTLAAVKRFQAGAGLAPDGIVGPKTWEALGGTGDLPSIRSQQVPPVPATGGV